MGNGLRPMEPRVVLHTRCQPRRRRNRNARTFTGGSGPPPGPGRCPALSPGRAVGRRDQAVGRVEARIRVRLVWRSSRSSSAAAISRAALITWPCQQAWGSSTLVAPGQTEILAPWLCSARHEARERQTLKIVVSFELASACVRPGPSVGWLPDLSGLRSRPVRPGCLRALHGLDRRVPNDTPRVRQQQRSKQLNRRSVLSGVVADAPRLGSVRHPVRARPHDAAGRCPVAPEQP